MEGATLSGIAKELAESPGDVLEKRVASALGNLPALDRLNLQSRVAPRGRVRRAFRQWAPEGNGQRPPDWFAREAPAGAWYRIVLADGVELEVRSDHPAAGSEQSRQRLGDAVARAVRGVAEEPVP
jgi:hypothetical protein